MAAGCRAGLEVAVGSEGRTNVRETYSLATSPSPSIHSSAAPLDRQGKSWRAPGSLKSGCLSPELKETKGLSEHKSLGLPPFPN